MTARLFPMMGANISGERFQFLIQEWKLIFIRQQNFFAVGSGGRVQEIIDSMAKGVLGWVLLVVVAGFFLLAQLALQKVKESDITASKIFLWGFIFVLVLCGAAYAVKPDHKMAGCVLDKMPGASNEYAVSAVMAQCKAQNPGGYDRIGAGEGRWLLDNTSIHECVLKYGKNTSYSRAAGAIRFACECLYGPKNTVLVEHEFINLSCSSPRYYSQ